MHFVVAFSAVPLPTTMMVHDDCDDYDDERRTTNCDDEGEDDDDEDDDDDAWRWVDPIRLHSNNESCAVLESHRCGSNANGVACVALACQILEIWNGCEQPIGSSSAAKLVPN